MSSARDQFVDRDYIATLDIERLRQELTWALDRHYALRLAFLDLPEVPHPLAQHLLSEYANFERDWPRGKTLQQARDLGEVPPNTECEAGAGLWTIIREALVAAKK